MLLLAGKVIGKKGSVITHLQRTTQSEVTVLTIPEIGSELWSPVAITGEPLRALQAYELIKDIVEGFYLFILFCFILFCFVLFKLFLLLLQ